MDKKKIIEMIKSEENTEDIYYILSKLCSAEELRDIAFECLCCIKKVENVKTSILEDIVKNLADNITWKE